VLFGADGTVIWGNPVSKRTVLRWAQACGPVGRRWYVDEKVLFRGKDNKWDAYRAVDEWGQVVDVLLRDHRDIAGAPRADSRRSPPASASWRASTPSERSVADTFGTLSWP